MIKSASDLWKEIATPNNLKFEFKTIAGVPVIVAKDFFKFPDKVHDFFVNGYWWDNFSNDNVRAG